MRKVKKQTKKDCSNDIWYIRIKIRSDIFHNVCIHWNSLKLSNRNKIVFKLLLVRLWKWYKEAVNQEITLSESQHRKYRTAYKFLLLMQSRHPDKNIYDLSKSELLTLISSALFHVWARESGFRTPSHELQLTETPLSKQEMERILALLSQWFHLFKHGENPDGPAYKITALEAKRHIRSIFKNKEIDFHNWDEGKSYGAIPFVVAHLLLADAISIVESKSTKQVLTFFEITESTDSFKFVSHFWNTAPSTLIGQYRKTGNNQCLRYSVESEVTGQHANDAKSQFCIPLHDGLSAHNEPTEKFVFPWACYSDFVYEVNKIRVAVLIIFLSVMGKRGPSEVMTLKVENFTLSSQNNNNGAIFEASIEKTHKGFRQTQGITDLIETSLNVLKRLSFVKKHSDMPLFSRLPCLTEDLTSISPIPIATMYDQLKVYYHQFLERAKSSVDFDVKALHPVLKTHQFRHSVADFALRRFDGDVEEKVRQLFCHSEGHWFTKKYTADKLDDNIQSAKDREYIKELIPRVLRDNSDKPNFVGAMAIYIKKTFSDETIICTPEEIENKLSVFSENIVSITSNEYGWCLLHKHYTQVANCADDTGIPRPRNTSSFKCNSCKNFLASRNSHYTKQLQIAIAHTDFIQQDIWKMPRLREKSKRAVKDAIDLFPELAEIIR